MITFKYKYFITFVAFLIIETLIAIYINDDFIRPHMGDVFVVILIYCFIKSFVKTSTLVAASSVLIFSYMIEILQYFHFVYWLGLENCKVAYIALGNTFQLWDFVSYSAGIGLVILCEFFIDKTVKKI